MNAKIKARTDSLAALVPVHAQCGTYRCTNDENYIDVREYFTIPSINAANSIG